MHVLKRQFRVIAWMSLILNDLLLPLINLAPILPLGGKKSFLRLPTNLKSLFCRFCRILYPKSRQRSVLHSLNLAIVVFSSNSIACILNGNPLDILIFKLVVFFIPLILDVIRRYFTTTIRANRFHFSFYSPAIALHKTYEIRCCIWKGISDFQVSSSADR